jgi:hypothetical protein
LKDEPVVFAWMPTAALFFRDPDGNLLEFLAMLPEPPQCDLGVVAWSRWQSAQACKADKSGRLEEAIKIWEWRLLWRE